MGAHHIAIVDMDIVEISNLHRQTLFDEEDAHTLISKVEAIKHKVNQININVNLTTYDLEVTSYQVSYFEVIHAINDDVWFDIFYQIFDI
jgi:sulfur carrier protein ThiS adenylyltransferase